MKRPVTLAIIGGAVAASAVTAIRLVYLKETKESLESIPYEKKKPLSWKNFFKNY